MNYYELVGWKNRSEGKVTKVSAERLNHMDNQILANANAIGNIEEIVGLADGTLCGAVKENKTDIETLTSNLTQVSQSLSKKNGISFKSVSASTSYSVAANSISTQSINRPSTPAGYKLMFLHIIGFSANADLSKCYPIYNGSDRTWVRNHSVANQTGNIIIEGIYYKIN